MSYSDETLGSAENDGPVGFWEDSSGRLFAGPFPSDCNFHYIGIDDDLILTWNRSAAVVGELDPLRRLDFLDGIRRIGERARILRYQAARKTDPDVEQSET